MRGIFRRKRTWLIIILLIIAAPLIYGYVMMNSFSWSEKEIADYFKNRKMKPSYNSVSVNGRHLFYATVGADSLPMVLFIHGAPGSWYDYIKYFADSSLVSKAHLVAVDRPGYGNSGVGDYMTSLDEQAKMIGSLLAMNHSAKPAVLVGHSYGGPIAARIAMNSPEKVGALVLLAPAIDPGHEKQFMINRLAGLKAVQWIIPKAMLAAYYEKKTHVEELKKMDGDWGKISSTTVYMYGAKDGIVPPVNVEYARRKITNAPLQVIEFPDENHFIPWTRQDSVIKVIAQFLQQ